MKAVHVDMAEVEKALARAMAAMEPITTENSSRGAQARMAIVVDVAFARQMAVEINLNTPPERLSDALACVCANMIGTFVDSLMQDEASDEERFELIERQLRKTARFLADRLEGNAEQISGALIRTQTGGRA